MQAVLNGQSWEYGNGISSSEESIAKLVALWSSCKATSRWDEHRKGPDGINGVVSPKEDKWMMAEFEAEFQQREQHLHKKLESDVQAHAHTISIQKNRVAAQTKEMAEQNALITELLR